MLNPNQKSLKMLLRWFTELYPTKNVAADNYYNITKKLHPYLSLYNITWDELLLPVLNDQTCTSFGKFKDLINIRIKRLKKIKFNK